MSDSSIIPEKASIIHNLYSSQRLLMLIQNILYLVYRRFSKLVPFIFVGHIKIDYRFNVPSSKSSLSKSVYWEVKMNVNFEIYLPQLIIIPSELAELTVSYTILCAHKFNLALHLFIPVQINIFHRDSVEALQPTCNILMDN